MKKALALVLGLGFLATACTPGVVVMAPTTSIHDYGSLAVVHDAREFLSTISGSKNEDNYKRLVAAADEQLAGHVRNWAAQSWSGKSGARPLTVRLKLTHYNTGSGAAKFFLGSIANGKLEYLVSLEDGNKVIAKYSFMAEVGLTGNSAAFWNMAKQIEGRIKATN